MRFGRRSVDRAGVAPGCPRSSIWSDDDERLEILRLDQAEFGLEEGPSEIRYFGVCLSEVSGTVGMASQDIFWS
jgi:hypothetical protein